MTLRCARCTHALARVCQCHRSMQVARIVAAVEHAETAACCRAERAFLRGMQGGCQVPIGAASQLRDGRLHLFAVVAALDGSAWLEAEATAAEGETPQAVGVRLADELCARGAAALVDRSAPPRPPTYGCAEARAD